MAAVAPLTMDIFFPSLPSIRSLFGITESYLQLSITLYAWGFGLAQLLAGVLSDRYGRKPIFSFGMLVFILASLGCAWSPSFELFLVFRVLQSMGACVGAVTSLAIARDLFEGKDRARVVSFVSSAMALAPIVAPMIGSFFEEYFSWRTSFLFLSAYAVLMLLVTKLLDETLRSSKPIRWSGMLSDYSSISRNRTWLLYTALTTLHFSAFFAWLAASSLYYIEKLGASAGMFSLLFGGTALAFMVGAMVNTWGLKTYGVHKMIGLGTILSALGGLGFVISSSVGVSLFNLWLSASFIALGLGFVMPASFSMAMEPFPHMAGKASALSNVLRLSFAGGIVALTSHFYDDQASGIAIVALVLALIQLLLWLVTLVGKQDGEVESAA